MKEQLERILQENPLVSEYAIRHNSGRTVSVRFAGDHYVKDITLTRPDTWRARVINYHDIDGRLYSGDTEDDILAPEAIRPTIERLVEGTLPQRNDVFHLPKPSPFLVVHTSYPGLAATVSQRHIWTLGNIRDDIRHELQRYPGVSLASFEGEINTMRRQLWTSTGVAHGQDFSDVRLELVFLAEEGGRKAEFLTEVHDRGLLGIDPQAIVDSYANLARDKLRATTPRTYEGPVVVIGDALREMMIPDSPFAQSGGVILYHANGSLAFNRGSILSRGKSILRDGSKPSGDTLSIMSDPLIDYGFRSTPIAGDGTPTKKGWIIKDSELANYTGDSQYIGFLTSRGMTDQEPLGPLGNIMIPPGTRTIEQLTQHDKPLLVVHAFSWFAPTWASGDFSVEIRMGYEIMPDGSKQPVSGGLLCGNLFDAMANVRMSSETTQTGNYNGPTAMRFENLKVAGK